MARRRRCPRTRDRTAPLSASLTVGGPRRSTRATMSSITPEQVRPVGAAAMRRWPSAPNHRAARAGIGSRTAAEAAVRVAQLPRRRRREGPAALNGLVPVAMAPEAGSSQYQELPDLSQPAFMTPELFMWKPVGSDAPSRAHRRGTTCRHRGASLWPSRRWRM